MRPSPASRPVRQPSHEACIYFSHSPRGRKFDTNSLTPLTLTTLIPPDVTGAEQPARVVLFIYDVFGFASQSLQGADRLAAHLGSDVAVLAPDLLRGTYVQPDWLPPDTPEKQRLFAEFRAGPAQAPRAVEGLLEVRAEVARRWPGADGRVAAGGLCWGGKISALACGEGNVGGGRRLVAAWTAHPG